MRVGGSCKLCKQVQVPANQDALGNQAHGIAEFTAHFQAAACQSVHGFQGLVAIGIAGEYDRLAVPRLLAKCLAQEVWRIDLHHNFSVKISTGAEVEILMS